MEPLYRNLLAALWVVVYVNIVVGGSDLCVKRNWLPSKVTRKIIHVAGASWIIFWPIFDPSHWTWQLNIVVPFMYSIVLFTKGLIIRDPNDADVRSMTRTGNPSELLAGPLLFSTIMCIVGIKLFMTEEAIVIMGCLGFGDGLAPLVGTYYPWGYYRTYPFSPTDRKTVSGSIAFAIAAVVGICLMRQIIMGDFTPFFGWTKTVQISILAAVVEGLTGWLDNPAICAVVYSTLKYTS